LEPFDADEYAPFVMSIVHETEVDEIRQERAPIGTVDPQKQVDVTGEMRFVASLTLWDHVVTLARIRAASPIWVGQTVG